MCGIVGAVAQNAQQIVIEGLRKLEYRGYDSAGVATIDEKNNLSIKKSVGMIANLESIIEKNDSQIGIGHTRWATHGPATTQNAHPHRANSITIVHNGIIENYKELKKTYGIEDKMLQGSTDTEVLANVIEKEYKKAGNILTAISNSLKNVIGSYALLVMVDGNSDELYVAKNKSPLLIGKGEGENFVASDAMAVIQKTKEFYELNDKEIAKVTKDLVEIFDINGQELPTRNTFTAEIDESSISKGTYEHFMLKEIDEQPTIIRKLINNYFDGEQLSENIDWKSYDEIHIVGCGTSYNAGLIGKKLIEQFAEVKTYVHVASEFNVDQPLMSKNSLVIFISQSGETADSREVLKIVKKQGFKTMALTNVAGSTLTRESDYTKLLYAGPEISVASTKAYTAQITVLAILADRIAKANGKPGIENLKQNLSIAAQGIEQMVSDKTKFEEIAVDYLKETINAFFIGRGKDYNVCLEAALKLKEISYILTEGFAAGELKHGTIALIREGTPVIALITSKKTELMMRSSIEEVKARGAKTATFVTRGMESSEDTYVLPAIAEELSPLVSVIAMQLISYYAALHKGCNIDKPANLAKSVTVM